MSAPPPAGASTPATTAQSASTEPPTRPSLGVVKRREANSNPLVARSKPVRRPVGARPTGISTARVGVNPPTNLVRPGPSTGPVMKTEIKIEPEIKTEIKTEIKEEPMDSNRFQEFKLTTTKREILAGYRHHVMRLQSKRRVNPMDPEEFTMPVRLHRRDPKAPLQGGKEQELAALAEKEKGTEGDDPMAAEERAKREAEKAAQAEKIAPYGGAQKQKKQAFKKKTQQVFKSNEADKKLRYEEYFPWFIEDFDNKNTWQGQLEQPLSNGTFSMFVLDEGAFRMVPIEKWYKFTEKNKFKTLSIEEAENALKKAKRVPRWLMNITRSEEKEEEARERQRNLSALSKLSTRRGDRLEKLLPKSETADADDLDFDDDRFADDEEAPIMDGEEQENKEIEKRIKKEQLSANVFDTRDEKEYEEEERERKRLAALRRKEGKKTAKALRNRENNHTYDSDSDENPYASSSEEEDEEELVRKEEERKKQEEEKKKEEERKKAEAASAKEQEKKLVPPTSAPELKPKVSPKKAAKPAGIPLDKKAPNNLKRAGSDELSESGNEKARKKPKKSQVAAAAPSSQPGLGQNLHQKLVKLKVPSDKMSQITSLTPLSATVPGSKKRKATDAAGNGSGEDTAGEGSDTGAKKQRVKLLSGGRSLSPSTTPSGTGSRQNSPAPKQMDKPKAASPNPSAAGAAARADSPAAVGSAVPITDEEILAAIPDEGTTTGALATTFKTRLGNAQVKAKFVVSLKRLVENRGGKMLFRRKGL